MQVTYPSPAVETSKKFKTSEVGVSERGQKVLAFFMRDKIYEDKPLAVCREYIFNALDEHRKYGINRPIKIHCPFSFEEDPEFSVRDYAKGLSDDGVRKIFGMIGETTKGDGDVGGFGIGAKVGNAYSDSFFVESFHNGERACYQFYLAPSEECGMPSVVKVSEIQREKSDEPSGILVRVPVKVADCYLFQKSLERVCYYIEGEYECNKDFDHAIVRELNGIRVSKAHTSMGLFAVQGGCVYEIPEALIKDHPELKKWAKLNGYAVHFPINSFDFTLSRDRVEGSARSKHCLKDASEKLTERLLFISERVKKFGLFKLARFFKRNKGIKSILIAVDSGNKRLSVFDETIHVDHKSRIYSLHNGVLKSKLYNLFSFKIPEIKGGGVENTWYVLEKDYKKIGKRPKYLFSKFGVERIVILDENALGILSENEIVEKSLQNVMDVIVPKDYFKTTSAIYSRRKIAVEIGDIEKANYYLISNYGKVMVGGRTFPTKNGMPEPIVNLGLSQKVVIIPKSQSRKVEKTDLKKFDINLKVARSAKKKKAGIRFLNEHGKCRYGVLWLKSKGLDNFVRSFSSYYCSPFGQTIRKTLEEKDPLLFYAIEGGGSGVVLEEIRKRGMVEKLILDPVRKLG